MGNGERVGRSLNHIEDSSDPVVRRILIDALGGLAHSGISLQGIDAQGITIEHSKLAVRVIGVSQGIPVCVVCPEHLVEDIVLETIDDSKLLLNMDNGYRWWPSKMNEACDGRNEVGWGNAMLLKQNGYAGHWKGIIVDNLMELNRLILSNSPAHVVKGNGNGSMSYGYSKIVLCQSNGALPKDITSTKGKIGAYFVFAGVVGIRESDPARITGIAVFA